MSIFLSSLETWLKALAPESTSRIDLVAFIADFEVKITSLPLDHTVEDYIRVFQPVLKAHRETCTTCPPPSGRAAIVTEGEKESSQKATAAGDGFADGVAAPGQGRDEGNAEGQITTADAGECEGA